MQKTIILGGGGHAKVVIEIMRAAGTFDPIGCLVAGAVSGAEVMGVPVLGDDDHLSVVRQSGVPFAFIAIGENSIRHRLLHHVTDLGFELSSALSPSATISPSVRLGTGLAVMPGAHIGPDVVVADGTIVNSLASVDHDCVLDECSHIGPGTILAGCVHVGAKSFVATGSSVIPDVTIGADSIIGAGSVVVRDISSNVVAFGCPAMSRRPNNGPPPLTDDANEPTAPRLRLVI